jgi:two-component system alkaline phosphatase synthesis response regulator PhoP
MLKLSILAVDDSPTITAMIKDSFENEGYRVLLADDGVKALKIALEQRPDLIIADIAMPGLDGWELCSQIRSNPFTSFIPFIFLTARAEAPDRIRGLQMGADDYLTKPFAMDELIARVNLIFQRMRKNQEAMILQERKTLSGSTSEMALPDLLQLFGLNQKTGVLRISKMGELTGIIALESGRIIGAELGTARDLKAIFRLLRWSDAHFEVAPLPEQSGPAAVVGEVQEILMEGMRQLDELAALERVYPLEGKKLKLAKTPAPSELSPREEKFLAAVAGLGHATIADLLNALPNTDYEVYRMTVYFLRQGILAAI